MSIELMITMLGKGSNGHEILSILDAITSSHVATEQPTHTGFANEPTLDEIPF